MDEHISRLSKLFLKFPGIGERQAKRFAYFILTQPQSYVETLAETLTTARGLAHTCTSCQRIYEGPPAQVGDPGLCRICNDDTRDRSTLVILEKSQDIDSFAKTDYHGLFFVLGGLIPIIQKNVLEGTNIHYLQERIKKDTTIQEVILAFPITPNGEHTDVAVREIISPLSNTLKVTSLGRGLSTGAELEYADAASLSASLKKRE